MSGGGSSSNASLTPIELRKKLLDLGVDLPVSVKKEFMIKILEQKEQERRRSNRVSLPPVLNSPPQNGSNGESSGGRRTTPQPGRGRVSLPVTPGRGGVAAVGRQNQQQQQFQAPVFDDPLPEGFMEEDEESEQEGEDQEESMESSPSPPPQRINKNNGTLFKSSLSSASGLRQRRVQEQEEEEEELEEDEEERPTPSPRYEEYLKFFKGDTSSSDPFARGSRSGASSPGSPFSTVATAGSPPPRYSGSFDDSADESEAESWSGGVSPQNQRRGIFNRISPSNWIGGLFRRRERVETETDNKNQKNQPNFNFGTSSSRVLSNAGGNNKPNGHFPSTSSRASEIYSPATPPPQQGGGGGNGLKRLFSRGGGGDATTTRNNLRRQQHQHPQQQTPPPDSSHVVPKLLAVCFTLAFLGLGAGYYYKTTANQALGIEDDLSSQFAAEDESYLNTNKPSPPPPSSKIMVRPICGSPGFEDDLVPCVPENIIGNSEVVFDALRKELVARSMDKCTSSDVMDKLTLEKAAKLGFSLVQMTKPEYEEAFQGMLIVTAENPTMNVHIEQEGTHITSSADTQGLDPAKAVIFAEGVAPSLWCNIVGTVTAGVYYLILFAIVGVAVYVGFRITKYRRTKKAREDAEVYDIIDRIVELLKTHYEESLTTGQEAYKPVNFIRDQLFPHRERKRKEGLWNRVVGEIAANESRIREEIQHISGEEFKVWRWLPQASTPAKRMSSAPSSPRDGSGDGLYPDLNSMRGMMEIDNSPPGSSAGSSSPSPGAAGSKWQGQAFEIFDGSPNSLAQPPTTCLKIRHMFDATRESRDRIQQAILEKCPTAKILHIGMERNNAEGCVYIRCMTKMDARNAYQSLHGWWFDGNLLSVKFLREDRYFTRFPEARTRTVPLTRETVSPPPQQVLQSSSLQFGYRNSQATTAAGY